MYNNLSSSVPPPVYGSQATDIYSQPIYSNAYEQVGYADNAYINSQPVYSIPSQPPPGYVVSTQPPSYAASVSPQPASNNANVPMLNPGSPGTPLSDDYKWPRSGVTLVCPKCGATVTTRVETSVTIITILGAVLLFLVTCILVCLPFCVPACKQSAHYCPYCNSILGVRKPLR